VKRRGVEKSRKRGNGGDKKRGRKGEDVG